MKDRVILYMAGFSAATIAGLGVILHQAMNVEANTRNDVNIAPHISSVPGMECVPASQCVPSDAPEVGQGER